MQAWAWDPVARGFGMAVLNSDPRVISAIAPLTTPGLNPLVVILYIV